MPATPAVLYARVSSKDQEKEGFSIPAQQKLLRAYAEAHGFHIEQEFTDVETAKKAGRTQFSRMLSWLKRNKLCRAVLVEKTDRLYRNLKDWVELDGLDLEIHLVKEAVVLSEGSRSHEKFIHGIKVLMAKNYIDNLSEETRKGMQEKAEQGIWPGPAPVGYLNAVRADGKRVIEVDPEMGPLVTRLFETYAQGDVSVQSLTREAAGWGLRSRRAGKPMHVAAIHYTLTNLLYAGEFSWKDRVYRASHTPLVSRELWDRVQERLEDRCSYVRREQKHEFQFSGLVRCGTCAQESIEEERLLVGEVHKGRYVYYRCEGCKRAGRKVAYVRQERIDEEIIRALRGLHLEPEILEWVRTALHDSHADERRFHEESLAKLQRQHAQLQRRLDLAYSDRLDGRISPEAFDRLAAGWRAEQARTRQEMAAHEAADQSYKDEGMALLELASRAAQLYERQAPMERRKLLNFMVSNSIWREGNLEVVWREPFDLLAKSLDGVRENENPPKGNSGGHSEWLPLVDLNHRPTD
jgi:DNA invertase Pin-like site-specific DNA recombinase